MLADLIRVLQPYAHRVFQAGLQPSYDIKRLSSLRKIFRFTVHQDKRETMVGP